MKTIILAAGFATRLRPLTDTTPKALLLIADKPILNHTLDPLLSTLSTPEIALVTNHTYADSFLDWQQRYYPTAPLRILDNDVVDIEHRLGAIGDLIHTLDVTCWDDDLLVLASDTLTSLNWPHFLDFIHQYSDSPATVVCPTSDLSQIAGKLGCAVVEEDRLIDFVEKPSNPPSNLRAVPFYYFPKNILHLIRAYHALGQSLDSPGSLLPYLLTQVTVYAYNLGEKGIYHDVGTLEVYRDLQAHPPVLL